MTVEKDNCADRWLCLLFGSHPQWGRQICRMIRVLFLLLIVEEEQHLSRMILFSPCYQQWAKERNRSDRCQCQIARKADPVVCRECKFACLVLSLSLSLSLSPSLCMWERETERGREILMIMLYCTRIKNKIEHKSPLFLYIFLKVCPWLQIRQHSIQHWREREREREREPHTGHRCANLT